MGSCFYCSEQKVSPYCSQKLKSLFITLFLLHFLFRVLSGIRTTHRQPSLIIETGKHTKTNQDTPSLVLRHKMDWLCWVRDSCLFLDDTSPSLERFITPGPWQVATLFVPSSVICLFFYTSSLPAKCWQKFKELFHKFCAEIDRVMNNILI